jgi:hypothetical protein
VSKSPVVEGIFYNFTLKLYYYFGFIGKMSDLPDPESNGPGIEDNDLEHLDLRRGDWRPKRDQVSSVPPRAFPPMLFSSSSVAIHPSSSQT